MTNRSEAAAIGTLAGILSGLLVWVWLVAVHPPWALRRCAQFLEQALPQ